ncbi:AAA domain-containing protein [Ruania suaedae]|uniref:AAA domain-containing protein n=1 Tax=Ruania suaedae TaxID=2897774 RepID=UPI001E622396|nr:AAA domain-containing protein [Ruania suaedae]UFU01870.1 AAA domain-containing protein [Ruania suaedae]
MNDDLGPDDLALGLHPAGQQVLEAFEAAVGARAEIAPEEPGAKVAVKVAERTTGFAVAEGTELRIVPFVGDAVTRDLPFVRDVRASWVEGEAEIVVDVASLSTDADRAQTLELMRGALEYWEGQPQASSAPDEGLEPLDATTIAAHLSAVVSDSWSWASSAAKISQISEITADVSEPLDHARLTISVRDADVVFGDRTLFDGPLDSGREAWSSVHIPLSPRVMSQIGERATAECHFVLEDAASGRVLARHHTAIDVQPRDLWFWDGDPRPGRSSDTLARALLASFVRPNHPEVAVVAREVAVRLGKETGDPGFHAFQSPDPGKAQARVDATVYAIYRTLAERQIAYSEPPPEWDYRSSGQRIRDHGDVARGGLGTCMDTTVLMAAVIEQVGLHPVLVLVHGHIFIGYWRRDPFASAGPVAEWYPNTPVIEDSSQVGRLIDGGWLGVIETTALTVGTDISAERAGVVARNNLAEALPDTFVSLIDVVAARKDGVSPLPAVTHRSDGVTEIIEYRPGEADGVLRVETESDQQLSGERRIDSHPARYRTWKSSLFSLNATNALLNLGTSARVQPIVIPEEGLGTLEDRLHQDVAFSLRSGWDVPELWHARDVRNALELLRAHGSESSEDLLDRMKDRQLYVQRSKTVKGRIDPASHASFVREIRSMAHRAKTAREERGMNPLFLCLGLLRWRHKPDAYAEAPMILVPVNIAVARGRQEIVLSLDATQQTTPNAALIEWLRREHGLVIQGLAEPQADRAGVDVDGVLAEVRTAIAERGLDLEVVGEAKLATLDLAAFRMWQDLNANAEHYFERPLVQHLVHTPTEAFEDPAAPSETSAPQNTIEEELEKLETPIPADSTQKRAVAWAREGRTFVLQGPPGTGKSQTITNMVAECLLSGLRVLFVAEKATALSVVQRRLESIGLAPFSLNLHHEGSNANAVRSQLKAALTAAVNPDALAMQSAQRQLKNARFELMQYPQQLHEKNAAGLSAYGAHDELLVLGDGPRLPLRPSTVAHEPERIDALREAIEDLQRWTVPAGVRPDHPWRFAGVGRGDPFDVEAVSEDLRSILDSNERARALSGPLSDALAAATHPRQLDALASAAAPSLPVGEELKAVLAADWPERAALSVSGCERTVQEWAPRLRGFPPEVLQQDLAGIAAQFETATSSGLIGRKRRQVAAIASVAPWAPPTAPLDPSNASAVLHDLLAVQRVSEEVRSTIAYVPGLAGAGVVPANPFVPGALSPARGRFEQLMGATRALRSGDEWTRRVVGLALDGHLAGQTEALAAFSRAWRSVCAHLAVEDDDLTAWRGDLSLIEATARSADAWRQAVDFERLVPLQRWCSLVRKVEPMRAADLHAERARLLEGALPADSAEEALARGVAQASLHERMSSKGLDRFDALAHDRRVNSYAAAQDQLRTQWTTDGPARLLSRRGGDGRGSRTGALARELEKTNRKLGTRALLSKHGEAVQELTPLVLGSPSSVVDLIRPRVMDFDVVIFDEASQITVPEAVGALGRARAAIVVGDSKQMPPSRRVGGASVDDEEVGDPDADEIVEDQESILSECELARVPTLTLSWHYRSQDEALIAFSNRHYYGGDLSSFPTPSLLSAETGLEFRRVRGPGGLESGLYLRARAEKVRLTDTITATINTNPYEAVEIVDYVRELVNSSSALPSIGIVTFNEQQRQLIQDLLEDTGDARVLEALDESVMGRGEALFVKALEQVQGDERDVVIFSIAFSKQSNGKVPTNFGPLSNAGGERRLNVAVTRARRKNVVFCSFNPASNDLDVSGSSFQGPKDLKEFLIDAQAANSRGEPAVSEHRAAIRDRHRDEIADALRDAGLHVMADVGLSNFRLDLVLARPDNPTRPLLPVLLDGESWKQRWTVSDRDVLPVIVLEDLMGWPSIARIWWPMWLQNRDEVVASILSEMERAEQILDERAAAVEPREPAPSDTVEPEAPEHLPARTAPVEPPADAGSNGYSAMTHRVVDAEAPAPVSEVAQVSDGTSFVPASTDAVGPREVLDRLSERRAVAQVRDEVVAVVESEGPIEVGRLARTVARRFGLAKVRAARMDDIIRLIPAGLVRRGASLGTFAWPQDLDPGTWRGYRYDPTGIRTLDEIAPEEIANAMRAAVQPHDDRGDELLRRTAAVFGIARLGAQVRSRLEAVRDLIAEPLVGEQVPVDPAPATEMSDATDTNDLTVEVERLAAILRNDIQAGSMGGFEAGNGYIQWQGVSGQGLFVEVGDGKPYEQPFDSVLAERLRSVGWRRPEPSEGLRNCWFSLERVDHNEVEHQQAARLRAAAEAVILGARVLREHEQA